MTKTAGNQKGPTLLLDHEVRAIRRLSRSGGWSYARLADRYQVGWRTIARLLRGETYTNVR